MSNSTAVSASSLKRINTTYFRNYTLARLTDEVTLRLSSYCDCKIFQDAYDKEYLLIRRPYQDKASKLIHRLHVYDKIPEFVINDKHLPQALISELKRLNASAMNEVITEAVRRLYESADYDYFHNNSIHSKVTWRFEV